MSKRAQGLGACLAVALVAGGCVGTKRHSPAHGVSNVDAWSFVTKRDDPIHLAVSGPVAVDVQSFNGDVFVIVDATRQWATVQIVREGTHGWGRNLDTEAAMDRIQYSVDLVPGDLNETIVITTSTADNEPWFLRSHVHIRAPAVDGVTIATNEGDVEVIDVEGPVHITSSGGNIRVMTNKPMLEAVTILNRRGDIDYRIRGESSGAFDCEAHNGTVDQRSRHGLLTIQAGTNRHRLLATLNGGENVIQLRTVDGDIRVAVVIDPTDVGADVRAP